MSQTYKNAIADEKSAVPYYQKLRNKEKQKFAKKEISRIIADEKRHKKILEEIVKRHGKRIKR